LSSSHRSYERWLFVLPIPPEETFEEANVLKLLREKKNPVVTAET
jgi:hypothetical protein